MNPNLGDVLRELNQLFNEAELRNLYFALGVDYDDLPGNTKKDKLRELMLYCQRVNTLDLFISEVRQVRPKLTEVNLLTILKKLELLPNEDGLSQTNLIQNHIEQTAYLIQSDEKPQVFTLVGTMRVGRQHHISAPLPNGKVLVAGGFDYQGSPPHEVLASAEIYNPISQSFFSQGRMTTRRYFSAATLLSDNTILITGGVGEDGKALDSIELYDPVAGTFASIGTMTTARRGHSVTLLLNGKVLITGGSNNSKSRLASAEIFDPIEGTSSPTGSMIDARLTEHNSNAILLHDGRVLITGGYGVDGQKASSEIYDPNMGRFSPTGRMTTKRACHALTLLSNNKVLVTGGYTDVGGHLVSAELYDPETGYFSLTDNMETPHFHHTATLLPNGKVLIVGGLSLLAEIYDPGTNRFTPYGLLNTPRYLHTCNVIRSGQTAQVLIVGGSHEGHSLVSAEIGLISESTRPLSLAF